MSLSCLWISAQPRASLASWKKPRDRRELREVWQVARAQFLQDGAEPRAEGDAELSGESPFEDAVVVAVELRPCLVVTGLALRETHRRDATDRDASDDRMALSRLGFGQDVHDSFTTSEQWDRGHYGARVGANDNPFERFR